MKKNILSLLICAALLTACGTAEEAVSDENTEAATVTTVEVTTIATEEITDETTAEETAETLEFTDFDEFLAADFNTLDGKSVDFKKCNMYNFLVECGNLENYYMEIDMNGQTGILCVEEDNMFFTLKDNTSGVSQFDMIICGEIAYLILNDGSGTAIKMPTTSEEIIRFTEVANSLSGVFKSFESYKDEFEYKVLDCFDVIIDGTSYTYEWNGKSGALMHEDGSLYTLVTDGTADMFFNKFTADIPDGIFDIPEDVTVIDYNEATAAENDTEATASSAEFADMEEFMAADFEAMETEEIYITDSNTYKFIVEFAKTVQSKNYYYDMTSGGQTAVVCYSDKNIYIKYAEDDTEVEIVVTGADAYMIMASEKMVIKMPADDEIYTTIEEMENSFKFDELIDSDTNLNDEKINCFNVTIDGKDYICEGNDDLYVLFSEKDNSYTFLRSGEIINFNKITSEIPEGIFDIPSDYTIIDYNDIAN